MHIPDGVLPGSVCAGGFATAGLIVWGSLRKIQSRPDPSAGIPIASVLTAAFFVASWIHIPLPPASAHLVLNGLMGVVLGAYAVPAIVVGLFLQAVMFQHGGLSSLGVNVTILGLPALLASVIYRWPRPPAARGWLAGLRAFAAGFLGLGISAVLAVTLVALSVTGSASTGGRAALLTTLGVAHLPLALIEGVLTAGVVLFLLRVKPTVLVDAGVARHPHA